MQITKEQIQEAISAGYPVKVIINGETYDYTPVYKYGMKYRGFSIGCQPMNGLIESQEDKSGYYFNILLYNRPLTEKELENYELYKI